jgi:hypothetical protein
MIFSSNRFQENTRKLATTEGLEYGKPNFGQRNFGIGKLSKRIRKFEK